MQASPRGICRKCNGRTVCALSTYSKARLVSSRFSFILNKSGNAIATATVPILKALGRVIAHRAAVPAIVGAFAVLDRVHFANGEIIVGFHTYHLAAVQMLDRLRFGLWLFRSIFIREVLYKHGAKFGVSMKIVAAIRAGIECRSAFERAISVPDVEFGSGAYSYVAD